VKAYRLREAHAQESEGADSTERKDSLVLTAFTAPEELLANREIHLLSIAYMAVSAVCDQKVLVSDSVTYCTLYNHRRYNE